jgi:hypothetical protein
VAHAYAYAYVYVASENQALRPSPYLQTSVENLEITFYDHFMK